MKNAILILAALAMLAASARKDAYVISTGDNNTFNTGTSLQEFFAVRKRIGTERCIWVRRGGQEYVIRDETAVQRALALFGQERSLAPEQEAVNREESQLDREADRLEDQDKRTEAEERRLEDLHARLRAVEQREKELDDRQEALEREAERAFWSLVDAAIRGGTAKQLAR